MLLAGLIAAPSYYTKKPLNHRQVRAKAHQIVQMLRQQDPRVLRSVMYYMKWVPRLEFKREQSPAPCKKDKRKTQLDHMNQWELDMLLDMAGFPRKRK